MIKAYVAPILSAALKKFKALVRGHEEGDRADKRLIVFCEDRLSLVAERAICEEMGGTFSVSVFTLSRFLTAERGRQEDILSDRGSAMVIRRLIEKNAQNLKLFRRLSTPAAAQEVYDTIALLYSSGVSADDIDGVSEGSELLRRKLHDIALLYREYSQYLESSGAVDRNAYLRALPGAIEKSDRIKGADVLFLGFNAFTSTVRECVRACMRTADNTGGVFIGDRGKVRLYQNEAIADFLGVAESCGLRAEVEYTPSGLPAEAELLRKNIFEPESLNKALRGDVGMDICPDEYGGDLPVDITEAADEEEECVFIAAHILKCIRKENIKPHRISVMLPAPEKYQPVLERIFNQYSIPFYVDRRYPLTSCFICSFVCDYLSAAADGMRLESVLAVTGNPLFCASEGERREVNLFCNYMLRSAISRGAVTREVNADSCAAMCKGGGQEECESTYKAVCSVREKFLAGRKLLPLKGDGAAFCRAVRALLEMFGVEGKLEENSKDGRFAAYPSFAAMSARAFGAFTQVLDEAENLTRGEQMGLREFIGMLKSGLAAAEISLIPPKQGAVFVGDISSTVNSGSDIIFAAGLTDEVPKSSQDISILTDGELVSVEKLGKVSPKISQLNRRVRELTALNVCAFSKRLYLVYPMRKGGDDCTPCEILDYARALFTTGGKALAAVTAKSKAQRREDLPYYISNRTAAVRMLADRQSDSAEISTVYALLNKEGERILPDEGDSADKRITNGRALYGGKISPTALETFYDCPYKCFMQRGLRLEERAEGGMRPVDSGNFIHEALQKVADGIKGVDGEEGCAALAQSVASDMLSQVPYSSLMQGGQGEYTARSLVDEVVKLSRGMYNQIAHSSFEISQTEWECNVPLFDGVRVGGRIDRVDSCGDIVRVIDYKTGRHDNKAESFYMGRKLQLPLYLSAAAAGKRPAGAYYFPAKLEYTPSPEGDFCLKGFMDGSADIVRLSDDRVEEKGKSAYVGAYLNGRKVTWAMEREEFAYFISYSKLIAGRGARGMLDGYVCPSPSEKACDFCGLAACCMYDKNERGVRENKKASCKDVAEIARAAAEKGE